MLQCGCNFTPQSERRATGYTVTNLTHLRVLISPYMLCSYCSVLFQWNRVRVLLLQIYRKLQNLLCIVAGWLSWRCRSASQISFVHWELKWANLLSSNEYRYIFSTFANIKLFEWIKYLTWHDEEELWGKTSELIVQNWCSHSIQRKRKKKTLKFSTTIKTEASARISFDIHCSVSQECYFFLCSKTVVNS